MFKIILALFLIVGLTVSTEVQASASLRARKTVQITSELKDSCIKNVVFKKDDHFLYIYGDLVKPCNSDFLRRKVIISLLDGQGRIINKLNAHVYYGINSNRYSHNGSFYVQTEYDPQIVSSSIEIQK